MVQSVGGESKYVKVGVSKNRGNPKSSILIGFSHINHPFWGTTILGNTQVLGEEAHDIHDCEICIDLSGTLSGYLCKM